MSYTQHRTKLGLNIARIEVPNGTIRAGVFKYDPKTGHDDLAKLRDTHRGTHAVARRRDQIVCLPRTRNPPTWGMPKASTYVATSVSLELCSVKH